MSALGHKRTLSVFAMSTLLPIATEKADIGTNVSRQTERRSLVPIRARVDTDRATDLAGQPWAKRRHRQVIGRSAENYFLGPSTLLSSILRASAKASAGVVSGGVAASLSPSSLSS